MQEKWLLKLNKIYYDSTEFRTRELKLNKSLTVASLDTMSDDAKIMDGVMRPLLTLKNAETLEEIAETALFSAEVAIHNTFESATSALLNGHALVFLEDVDDKCIGIDTRTETGRSIIEPPTSVVLRGPREGFVEDFKVNLTLLRKRLKTSDFKTQNIVVGKYTNTTVAVCYIDGIASSDIVNKVIQQVQSIETDGILDSTYVSRYLDKPKTLFFNRVGTTEKPDVAVGKLLEGRVIIIVDGSPIVLTLPYLFLEDLQTPSDYYQPSEISSVSRILRFLSVIASILLPALFVCLQKYNYQIIPIKFLITVLNATEDIPFSTVTEMLIVIIIFDILREANLRMPTMVGISLSLVGAIVLGDAAVKAGLLGTPAVMVGALSGIGLYTMPENTLVFSILRLLFIILAALIGLFGVLAGIMALICYMCSMQGLGSPYLAPYAPLVKADRQDAVLMTDVRKQNKRPISVKNQNPTRGTEE